MQPKKLKKLAHQECCVLNRGLLAHSRVGYKCVQTTSIAVMGLGLIQEKIK
jgi:hypothetical protein